MAMIAPNAGLPPDPTAYQNWREYARALLDFQIDQQQGDVAVRPQAVLLRHVDTSGTAARATVDGLLVFDPVLGQIMVSIGGAWKEVEYTP